MKAVIYKEQKSVMQSGLFKTKKRNIIVKLAGRGGDDKLHNGTTFDYISNTHTINNVVLYYFDGVQQAENFLLQNGITDITKDVSLTVVPKVLRAKSYTANFMK